MIAKISHKAKEVFTVVHSTKPIFIGDIEEQYSMTGII